MWDPDMAPSEPIVLATDGTKACDSAVETAASLGEIGQRDVKVVTVLEPPPIVAGEYGFIGPVESIWLDRRGDLLSRVRNQIHDVLTHDPGWLVTIRAGLPAPAIADTAAMLDAALIVMGLGQHHLIDRALGSETAVHTLRSGCTPILAVPQVYEALPRRAIVAVDFGEAGLVAAQQALLLLPTLSDLFLVHVAPQWDMRPREFTMWQAEYERDVGPAFARIVNEIDVPSTVNVTTVTRHGKTTKELMAAATEYEADVIVVGSKGLGLLDRMLVGSTASGIIRGAQCAVFAMPLAGVATRARRRPAAAAAEW